MSQTWIRLIGVDTGTAIVIGLGGGKERTATVVVLRGDGGDEDFVPIELRKLGKRHPRA